MSLEDREKLLDGAAVAIHNEPRARKAAEAIEMMVAKWLEKMNLPTTNKQGREIFIQTMADIIELHYAVKN